MKQKRSQRGFTLVEIAIVLVIIGLIVGGVLTAQQVSQNAKITNAVQGIKSYQAAVQTYNQNYGALPGDDLQAKTRLQPTPPDVAGGTRGNGVIDGAYDNTASAESQLFWNHLRLAGLIKGSGVGLPSNPFSGIFGVQNNAFEGAMTGNVLCLNQVSGSAATAIDQQLDDGLPDAGILRASTAINAAPATSYNSTTTYVLCTGL
jgi:prepilin-type N-terminal cleavage/methylation domain-containing protein